MAYSKLNKQALIFVVASVGAVGVLAAQEGGFRDAGGSAGGLTVTGTRETTQEIIVIDKEEIRERAAFDLVTLLQEAAGLGVTRYGPYGNAADINMRGFDGERVAFLLDGVPVNSGVSGDFDLSRIDLGAIERIEIIYGGADSTYNISGALGGVINIITTKEQPRGLALSAAASSTGYLPAPAGTPAGEKQPPHWEDLADTQNATLSATYGARDFSLKAGSFFNRAANHFVYNDAIFGILRRTQHNEVYDGGAGLSGVYRLPRRATLSAALDGYYGSKNIPAGGDIYGTQTDTTTRESIMLDAPYAASETVAVEASVTHQWQGMTYARQNSAPADSSRFDLQTITAINRWTWFPHPAVTLRAAGDWRLMHLTSNTMGTRARQDGGISVTGEFAPHTAVLIVPSVKLALCESASNAAVPVPKLGLALRPAPALTFKNNYYRSFKHPDFEDLYWPAAPDAAGNPALKPEDGWGADFGASYRHHTAFSLDSTLFAQWTRDSIHWSTGVDGVWRPYNVGEAAFFGVDARATFNIPLRSHLARVIRPGVTYQYMRSYLLSYGYSWESGKHIPYMPEHTLDLTLGLYWRSGSAVAGARYQTRRYHNTDNSTELPPYFLLNLTVNQALSEHLGLFGALRNITNTSYQSFYDHPMPGFTMTFGVRLNLRGEEPDA